MTSFSKFFEAAIQNRTCQEMAHPWTSSCHRAWFEVFLMVIPGIIKLVVPFCLLPLVYTGFDSDWTLIKKTLDNCIRAVVVTNGLLFGVYCLSCVFKKIFGKFYISTIIVIPFIISSALMYFLRSSLRKSQTQAFFGFVLEAAVKNSKNPIIRTIRNSKMCSTLVFMCISSAIMYHLKKAKHAMFWFIQPTIKNKSGDEQNNNVTVSNSKQYCDNPEFPGWGKLNLSDRGFCDHDDLCDKHALNGFLSCAKFGLGIEAIKRIISSADLIKTNPLGFLQKFFFSSNYNLTKFMVAYGVLFRISNCYFNRKYGGESPKTTLLAGIVAGVAFSLAPNYYFFTYGFSIMVQLIWHALGRAEPQTIPNFDKIYNLPWSYLLFGIFAGLTLHIRVFKPKLLPSIAVYIVDIITYGQAELVAERIRKLAMNFN